MLDEMDVSNFKILKAAIHWLQSCFSHLIKFKVHKSDLVDVEGRSWVCVTCTLSWAYGGEA